MRISFDLDDTLIIPNYNNIEPLNFIGQLLKLERLRLGTRLLLNRLSKDRHEVWIYTSSERSTFNIRALFWFHGIRLDGIVNGKEHRKESNKKNSTSSKNPTLFNIDLHVDDSIGVEIEGNANNFSTLLIDAFDLDWAEKVREKIYSN